MRFVVRGTPAFRNAFIMGALCAFAVIPGTGGAQEDADSPWGHAALYRDEWGTPHVYAENPRALAFVFGYAQAEDHLEAMLAAYRIANGRAAEVFGESYAASDEFSLKMGHAALARNIYAGLDPLTQDLCEGFAMGVNSWLVEHAEQAPPWADGAKPQDILALLHCYLMSMAPFDLPGVYHRPPASVSGNAWAIAPSRTDSGETFLVINPHADYGSPFLWYEAHLVCQDMDVAGATLFGLPVILQGHNESLGWALTPNQADFADIYLEPNPTVKRNPNSINTRTLLGEGQLMEMYLLANTQPYTVLTPQGPVERGVPCVDTPRGPLMDMHKGRLCSYLVGGYRDFGAIAQFVEMARARDLGSFRTALDMQQLPCFNVVYADREGNIFYLYNVKTGNKAVADAPPEPPKPEGVENEGKDAEKRPPRAPRFIDWTVPVPADDPLAAWGPIIPPGALPTVINPDSGYVQACGSPPWLATDNSSMSAARFPPWFTHDRDTYRAQRVRRLLGMGKRSFRDCQSMLYDVVVPLAIEAVPRLLDIAKQRADFVANAHPDLPAGLDALRTWNFLADASSSGMTFFHAWWNALEADYAAANGQPTAYSLQSTASREALLAALRENGADMQDLSLNAATEAARMMRNEFNSLSVPWGDVHTVTRGGREAPLCGADSGEPVFVASDEVFEGRKWRVTYGYGYAMVVAFGEYPRSVSMLPFGTSEDPKSPHYSDQLDLMTQRRFKVSRYLMEDVQQNAASARGQLLYLRPKGMEALFTLTASTPIVARLTTSTGAPGKRPEEERLEARGREARGREAGGEDAGGNSGSQSPIPNPQSAIPNPQTPIGNPQSPIPNPQSPIPLASSLSSSNLPEGLVPFTLFVTTERVPRNSPMSTHIEIFIPPVLCASQDLDKLAIYVHRRSRASFSETAPKERLETRGERQEAGAPEADPNSSGQEPKPETRNPKPEPNWTRLEAQQLNPDARTFIADDPLGPSTYVVLGPSMYRATRLAIPEEKTQKISDETPETASPQHEPNAALALPIGSPQSAIPNPESLQPPRKSRVTWGTPPKTNAKPMLMPPPEAMPATEPPQLEMAPPNTRNDQPPAQEEEKPAKKKKKATAKPDDSRVTIPNPRSASPTPDAKRNFSFATPKPDSRTQPQRRKAKKNQP